MTIPSDNSAFQQAFENFTPSPTHRSFAGITPSRYHHPSDKKLLAALRSAAGIEDLVRLFNENVQERRSRVENLAMNLRVSERQLPGLHRMFCGCCERLGVMGELELYLGHVDNAWTSGSERPYVTFGYPLLARLATAEAEFVIGHELGHILAEHVLYHQVARWALGTMASIPIVGTALQRGLGSQLFWWLRMAEFTADRTGLLAMGDVELAGRLLMKLAGYPLAIANRIDLNSCMEQAAQLDGESERVASRFFRSSMEDEQTHPWAVLRAGELFRWAQSSEYQAIVRESLEPVSSSGPAVRMLTMSDVACEVCGTLVPVSNRFCSRCGAPLKKTHPTTNPPTEARS